MRRTILFLFVADTAALFVNPFADLLRQAPISLAKRNFALPRHPDLVRLTGRHPFNVEPPLSKLMEQGFITPAALHYVRNHGADPDPLIPCLHAARSG